MRRQRILPRSAVPAGGLSASSTTVACSADATVSFGGELGLNAVGEGHAMAGAEEDAGAATAGATAGAGAAGCASLAAAMLAGAIPGGAATVAGILLVLAPVLGFAAAKGGGGMAAICAGAGGGGGAGAKAGVSAAGATAAPTVAIMDGSLGFLISIKAARASVAVVVLAVWMAT